jgi:hypothetical protein
MNLLNDESGSWDQSKQHIQQDLATIQATINQILAQINAPAAPTAKKAAVIAPSNQVTIPNGVTTAHSGALYGNGLSATPLGVNVDGTTVTVNSKNQLVAGSSLVLATSSALSGAGTVASPLAVAVDGTTITINGSNQLQSLLNGLSKVTVSLNVTQIQNLNTTFVQMIAGITNKIIYPVALQSTVLMSSPTGYAFNTTAALRYNSTGTLNISGSVPVAFATGSGAGTWDGLAPAVTTSSLKRGGTDAALGAGVYIVGSGANAGTPTNPTSTTLTMYYVVF